jgi:hypothetical protein
MSENEITIDFIGMYAILKKVFAGVDLYNPKDWHSFEVNYSKSQVGQGSPRNQNSYIENGGEEK